MYYLRFTSRIEQEIKNKEVSYFKTPSMKKAVKLQGLCAFSFDPYDERGRFMSDEDILSKIQVIADNQYYLDCSVAVFLEGEYLGNNSNGEGVIIKPLKVIKEFYL